MPGVELRPLPDATECCGFGGTFAVRNADVSGAMLADKLRCVGDDGRRRGLCLRRLLSPPHPRRARAATQRGARGPSRRGARDVSAPASRATRADVVRARGARDPDRHAGSRQRAPRDDVDPCQAGGRRRGDARLGGAAPGGRGNPAAFAAAPRRAPRPARVRGHARRWRGALGGRRRRRERDRDGHRAAHRRTGGREGEVAHDRRDPPQRGARGRRDPADRDRPRRARRAARRRAAVAPPRPRHPPRPARDRRAPAGGARPARPPRRSSCADRGGAGLPAGGVPACDRRDLRGERGGRGDGHRVRRRVGGKRAHVHDAARTRS